MMFLNCEWPAIDRLAPLPVGILAGAARFRG
jgi:hypothetical protein